MSLSSAVPSVQAGDVYNFQEAISLQYEAGPLAFLQEVCKDQHIHLYFPFASYYTARSPRPCRTFFLPTIMAVVIILLHLGTSMPWLASKRKNYFLFPLHTPVAFNWMQSILSSLPREMLEGGLGKFKGLPCPGSETNES